MSAIIKGSDLTEKEKTVLFWASFLALAAAGFGFSFRVAMGVKGYGLELGLTNLQIGQIFGATLWPIALTMIGFSLVVDRTGYKVPMYGACVLQVMSGIGTFFANGYGALYLCAAFAGLGHGIIEAVINPMCAAIYPKEKTKWLAILHAAWPAGLVFGTLIVIGTSGIFDGWRVHALWIVLPAIAYGFMVRESVFPVDERVEAGVPYMEMLKQIGFLSASLAGFMMVYEIGNQVGALTAWTPPSSWFTVSLALGLIIGAGFGFYTKSVGRPLFFLLCLLMIPIATAELGTDQWIQKLMTPVIGGMGINPAFALVFSASIMLIFRVFAGNILKFFTPPSLLCLSGLFSALGLWGLSGSSGIAVLGAFTIYALGQTYYWPCILGFTSEQYPEGGALTLNTVSAIGLLSVGIIGGQLLGVAFDKSIHSGVSKSVPALVEAAEEDKSFLGMSHQAIIPGKKDAYIATLPTVEQTRVKEEFTKVDTQAGRDVLSYAVRFPAILVIAFGAIILYFRSRGGYKPIELVEHAGNSSG
jgi:MFS family permease|tara:strand:- start:13735 stop:15321 length:1587 start_codon:yes stop_codon:yes gene_type:complete